MSLMQNYEGVGGSRWNVYLDYISTHFFCRETPNMRRIKHLFGYKTLSLLVE